MMDLAELEAVLVARRENPPAGSYAARLVDDPEHAARKVMEESFELCVELMRAHASRERIVAEAADVVFHVLAGLVGAGVEFEEVLAELEQRRRDR